MENPQAQKSRSAKALSRLACLAGLLLLIGGQSLAAASPPRLSGAGNPIVTVRFETTVIQAEVVASPEKLYLGLGGRQQLAPGTGMLFILPRLEVQHFCMRGMLIPIDIIWLAQGRVTGFDQNISPDDASTFSSPGPADMVLEVPAGFVASAGLQVGDRLQRQE